jgi:hypothetical protein
MILQSATCPDCFQHDQLLFSYFKSYTFIQTYFFDDFLSVCEKEYSSQLVLTKTHEWPLFSCFKVIKLYKLWTPLLQPLAHF